MYVVSVYFKCFICSIRTQQVFHPDVRKLDLDIAYVSDGVGDPRGFRVRKQNGAGASGQGRSNGRVHA